jgi:hypothetical protein
VEREKGFTYALFKRIGKMLGLRLHIHMKGWELIKGASEWCVAYYLIVWGIGGWCLVCIRKWVENGVVVVCEKINEQCEL